MMRTTFGLPFAIWGFLCAKVFVDAVKPMRNAMKISRRCDMGSLRDFVRCRRLEIKATHERDNRWLGSGRGQAGGQFARRRAQHVGPGVYQLTLRSITP